MLGFPPTLGVFKKVVHSVLSLVGVSSWGGRSMLASAGYDINVFDFRK